MARPATDLPCAISTAVIDDTKIWAPRTGIPHRRLVSSNVQGYFEELIDDAQEAILSMVGQRTLLPKSVPGILTYHEIRQRKSPPDRLVREEAPGLSEFPGRAVFREPCDSQTCRHLND